MAETTVALDRNAVLSGTGHAAGTLTHAVGDPVVALENNAVLNDTTALAAEMWTHVAADLAAALVRNAAVNAKVHMNCLYCIAQD